MKPTIVILVFALIAATCFLGKKLKKLYAEFLQKYGIGEVGFDGYYFKKELKLIIKISFACAISLALLIASISCLLFVYFSK